MQYLGADHEQQLRVVFNIFQRNGVLGATELNVFLAALNGTPSSLAPQLLQRYGGGGGQIDFPSFVQLVCNEPLPGLAGSPVEGASAVKLELARVFSAADVDGDSMLGGEEVKALMEADGSPASAAEVEAVMEEVGVDKGRGITLEQFLKLCVSTQGL